MSQSNRDKFLAGHYGQKLIKEYSLDAYGTWNVLGADSNCDFGGSHHMPYLGIFQGKLTDVIDIAVAMPGFWSWGSGEIKRVVVQNVEDKRFRRRKEIREQIEALREQIESLEDEYNFLEG